MKILSDKQVEQVDDFFSPHGTVLKKSGRDICRDDLKDIDVLIIRSITRVNEHLLKGTPVKFVGSATGGADHVDIAYLNQQGIAWSVAPGCNAPSVADYVLSCVACLQKAHKLSMNNPIAGVVGVGHVGKLVSQRLSKHGFSVLNVDPIRAEQEARFHSCKLSDLSSCDIVCLHTPLTKAGKYSTYHMVDEAFLSSLKPGCVLLNAARGAVIDFVALKKAGEHLIWCFDVFDNEPAIDLDVLRRCEIATPHVAGYAIESKYRGTRMIYEAACKALQWKKIDRAHIAEKITEVTTSSSWRDDFLCVYDPAHDTALMKATLLAASNVSLEFDRLRQAYPVRHEATRSTQ